MKILLLLLLPYSVLADSYGVVEDDHAPSAEEILIKKPEKFLRNESMIYDFNPSLGIKDQRRFTGSDRNRFSFAGHLYGNYEQLTDLLGVEVVYMRKSSFHSDLWFGAQVFQHKTIFGAITENPVSGTDPNADAGLARPNDSTNTVTGFGAGVGYRFKLLLDFLDTEDVFETVDVFLNVIQLNESFVEEQYRGYGLTANYGIHKRSSTSYFYGGKLSYNIASVTREAIGNEDASERSLTLGWPSLALEIGFFY